MNIPSMTVESLRQRMGSEATTDEAIALGVLLDDDGITDTEDVSDEQWWDYCLIARAAVKWRQAQFDKRRKPVTSGGKTQEPEEL